MDPVSGRFPGNAGPDVLVDVRTGSLQAAIDAASDVNNDGYIIIGVVGQDNGVPGGTGQEEIDISRAYGKPFAIVACGVSLTDPLPCDGQPVVRIRASATSPEHPVGSGTTLYVQDLTAVGSASAPGWLVKGDGRFLEGIGSQMHTQGGVKIVGNGNTMRNGFVSRNVGNGLTVQGQNNTVSGVAAMDNAAGDGISVSGSGNTVTKNAAGDQGQGNGGAGISVSGTANLVKANTAYANYTDGIDVAGGTVASPNIVKNNVAGGPQRGNTSRGISVSGAGPGAAGAVDIAGNVTQANGLVGLSVAGTGHRLKDNASGGATGATNGACQFSVASGNTNATGNTRNGAPIAGADGTAFPNGCF